MKNKYIIATDTYDNKVFAVCIFNVDTQTIVVSENILGEEKFKKRIEELTKFYNPERVVEYIEPVKPKTHYKIPHISESIAKYKGKEAVLDFLKQEDCFDQGLINEILNFAKK